MTVATALRLLATALVWAIALFVFNLAVSRWWLM